MVSNLSNRDIEPFILKVKLNRIKPNKLPQKGDFI